MWRWHLNKIENTEEAEEKNYGRCGLDNPDNQDLYSGFLGIDPAVVNFVGLCSMSKNAVSEINVVVKTARFRERSHERFINGR